MNSKKILMTLASRRLALTIICCCALAVAVFTACDKNDDKFSYSLKVESAGALSGVDVVAWRDAVMTAYMTELGVDSENFEKFGTEEDCNQEVLNACKRAEMSLRVGGAGEVVVVNITTRKTVYRRTIQ